MAATKTPPATPKKTGYSADHILTKRGLAGVRAAFGMYAGEGGAAAVLHQAKEVLDNCADEFAAGRCSRIHVSVDLVANVYAIMDDGAGIPTAKLRDVTSELHSSGKFKDAGGYTDAGGTAGTHGVGLKVTNALSDRFVVVTMHDGYPVRMEYRKGVEVDDAEYEALEDLQEYAFLPSDFEHLGTLIAYRPDFELLSGGEVVAPPPDVMLDWLEAVAMFNPGLRVTVRVRFEDDVVEHYEFQSESVAEYVDVLAQRYGISHFPPPFVHDSDVVSCAFTPVKVDSETFAHYVNSSQTSNPGSLQLVGFREALHKALQPYCSPKQTFTPGAVLFGLLGFINARVDYPRFAGQTKEKLVSVGVDKAVRDDLLPALSEYFDKHKTFAKQLVANAALFAKSQESAQDIRKAETEFKERSKKLPSKLRRCMATNPEDIELYIVEGDSAEGNSAFARDKRYQEVHTLRGKFLNAMKATKSAVLTSKATAELIDSLCGSLKNFDDGKLRVGKIMLTPDPDIDGYHISNLCHAFLHRFMPHVYAEGRVYVVLTPLFKGSYKDKSFYGDTLDDVAQQMNKAKLPEAGRIYTRFKGLGEMKASDFHRTIFDPKTRKLRRVDAPTPTEAVQFSRLMDQNVGYRRCLLGLADEGE